MEELKKILAVFGLLCLVGIPAFAPELFIGLSLVVWPITYIVLWIMSIGSDPSNTVPWTVFTSNSYGWSMVFLFSLLGLINGGRGFLAMLLAWGPGIMLPVYMISIGVAVYNDRGWTGYMYDNYQDSACEMRPRGLYDGPCVHHPLPGHAVPVFATGPDGSVLWTKGK